MNTVLKVLFSLLLVVIAIAHVFAPAVTIDTITLILIVIALIPWFIPYIKGLEIPGVMKIDLSDTKAATDKLKGDRIVQAKTGQIEITTTKAEVIRSRNEEELFESLRRISKSNPNLVLVGFRIEVEKKINQLAKVIGLQTDRMGLQKLVRELVNNEVISKNSASGLFELIALGNQAAQGANVTTEAAEWVLDVGPSILLQLERMDISYDQNEN